jgi:hypothetical protein
MKPDHLSDLQAIPELSVLKFPELIAFALCLVILIEFVFLQRVSKEEES